jgi:hypothetical protein
VGSAPGLRRWRVAFARRVRPGRAGTGWVRGRRRRSLAGPFANDLRPLAPSAESSAGITRPLAGIGRKRPASVASCNGNPGRSGVRPGGCRTIFDGPGPRRPPSGFGGLESASYQPGHLLQPTRRTTGESARRRRRPLNPHQASRTFSGRSCGPSEGGHRLHEWFWTGAYPARAVDRPRGGSKCVERRPRRTRPVRGCCRHPRR